MKKSILLIIILIFITASSVQATMINILDTVGSISGKSSLLGFEIFVGSLQSEQLSNANGIDFSPSDYNKLVKIQPNSGYYSPLIAILERTFTPYMINGPNGQMPDYNSEMNAMWNSKDIWGSVMFFCGDTSRAYSGSVRHVFNINPIPDLSEYKINNLYIYSNIAETLSNINYEIQLYADVTTVPEPSTIFLLVSGLAGMIGAMALKRK